MRFVEGRPLSSLTTRFLSWCAEKLQVAGKEVLLLICATKKHLRADLIESLVWEGVSRILAELKRLRRGLQKMLAREQEVSAVDHEEEVLIWQEKLTEVGRKRANFQELAAEGFMTKEELRSKLDILELACKAADRDSGSSANA